MRVIFVLTLILCVLSLNAQEFQENFEVKNFLSFFKNDSIVFNFNNYGGIVNKYKATYFRKGKIDKTFINVIGNFKDYYTNGKIALDATMIDNNLNGKANYYYNNRKNTIKATGFYNQNVKDSLWTQYYKNGRIKKIVKYSDGFPIIDAYYSKRGKQLIVKGNGYYNGEYKYIGSNVMYKIKGQLINGKMEGWWVMLQSSQIITEEFFKNGIFVKGISMGYEYTDINKITLLDFIVNESVNLYDNNSGWSENLFLRVDLNFDFPLKYLSSILDFLNESKKDEIENQWIFVSFKMNKTITKEDINIKSSINDTRIEELVYEALNSEIPSFNFFNPPKDSNMEYLFTILVYNNEIIIPIEYILKQKKLQLPFKWTNN